MFSNLSSSSISRATDTPSLVMVGAPNDLSKMTLRPVSYTHLDVYKRQDAPCYGKNQGMTV